jgi:hypothetical protein
MINIAHVYCLECNYFQGIPCTQQCFDCPCNGCECRNPEDSMDDDVRPKYKEKDDIK